jgi:type IV pilus assembly protein PilA
MHMKISRSSQRGFSLIELLIVVAVIGIIASISITYLLQAKQAARSSSAVSAMRLIHSSEISYRASYGSYGDLTALSNSKFLNDPDITAGRKSQYDITVTPDAVDASQDYEATASPISDPNGDYYNYFINATGVLRYKVGATADSSSPPVN